jgi:hypothetical protein
MSIKQNRPEAVGAVGYFLVNIYTIVAPAGFITTRMTIMSTETRFPTIASRTNWFIWMFNEFILFCGNTILTNYPLVFKGITEKILYTNEC